jgi:hypothetical protein
MNAHASMRTQLREKVEADPGAVLEVLCASERPLYCSTIAAEIHGIEKAEVRLSHVRGVSAAAGRLCELGLAQRHRRVGQLAPSFSADAEHVAAVREIVAA